MSDFRKDWANDLIEAERLLRTADHLIYNVYPIAKDSKLILSALENIFKSATINISAILKFEFVYKRVKLTKDSKKNLELFFNKCAPRYDINEEDCATLKQIFLFRDKHKESCFEFSKSEKLIMLNDSLGVSELKIEDLKRFLRVSKQLLNSVNKYSIFRKV